MMYSDEYLDFLHKLDRAKIRTHYARIIALSFDEMPIVEIQGKITGGNISVNTSSAIRRTLSLTMSITKEDMGLINVDTKIKVEVGLKNPFVEYREKYGETIWFPQGIYIVTTANESRNTNGWQLSITGKDKMCRLDGTCGGTIPGPLIASEREIQYEDGTSEIEQVVLRQMIFEAVNHFGGESANNIIINDLDDEVKMLVAYRGTTPIYFKPDYSAFSYEETEGYTITINPNDDIGRQMTPFTYPSSEKKLTLNAGSTVVNLLDQIVQVLGNFEYFYDIDGHFIFQEIKNYINNQSPSANISQADYSNENYLPNFAVSNYTRIYSNATTIYEFRDLQATAAITKTPKLNDLKNDFCVWGVNSSKIGIHYRLSIATKPTLDLAKQYMWMNQDGNYRHELDTSDARDGIAIKGTIYYNESTCTTEAGNLEEDQKGLVYLEESDCWTFEIEATPYYIKNDNIRSKMNKPCTEWREELYRQALMSQTQTGFGEYDTDVYSELIAEWRGLYDPNKEEWKNFNYWNPDVYNNPGKLRYWLDFIDTNSALSKYAIENIGRRTKVVNNNNIKTIYNKEAEDVIFIDIDDPQKEEKERYYRTIGQKYCEISDTLQGQLWISSTGASCYDEIRNLLYQHLTFNTTIGITCLPIYYLEPNNLIYVEDIESNIIGNYQITQFTLPLTYNGTMNITAMEVFTRI